jgi:carbon-monoxide dehydrogenase large subunit
VPAYRLDTSVVFTNKISTSPMRGAGRPQAVFAVERLLDRAAQVLGLDRAEIRRRNLIPPEAMPYKVGLIYRDGQPLTYDSGDYPQCQQMALDTAGWAGFEARRAAARAEGRYLGIGLANYVEGTGLGPFEGATARLLPSGRILLRTGAASQGQGHRTVLAQIAADAFGVEVDEVDVEVGDTASVSVGVGAFASRLMVNAGSAVGTSSAALALKLRQIAAAVLDAELDDIELSGGVARVMGSQGGQISFREIAKMSSGRPGFSLPRGIEPGLEATSFFAPPQAAYSNGSHVAEVEVDPETGLVRVTRYVVAHDCGRVINPLLVDGQIQGGVAHGIGNAIMERMRYDEAGNPQTTSLADYLLPDAGNVPNVEIVHMESPSPLNPLGVKGAGEGGTIPAAAAIASAIEDALSPFGVKILDAPMLPETIAMLVKDAQARRDAR